MLVLTAIHHVFCKNYFPGNFSDRMSVIVVSSLIIYWEGCNCAVRLLLIVFSVAENHKMPLGPNVSGWRIMSPFNNLAFASPTSLFGDASSTRGQGELTDNPSTFKWKLALKRSYIDTAEQLQLKNLFVRNVWI